MNEKNKQDFIMMMTRMATTSLSLAHTISDSGDILFSDPTTEVNGEIYMIHDLLCISINYESFFDLNDEDLNKICNALPKFEADVEIDGDTLNFYTDMEIRETTSIMSIQFFIANTLLNVLRFNALQELLL